MPKDYTEKRGQSSILLPKQKTISTERDLWLHDEWMCRDGGRAQTRGDKLGLCDVVKGCGWDGYIFSHLSHAATLKIEQGPKVKFPGETCYTSQMPLFRWPLTKAGYAQRRAFCRRMV